MAFKNNDPCRDECKDNEPIFTLRAQDITASDCVEVWIFMNKQRLGPNHPKIVEAREVAQQMREWPNRKLPD